ncbi:MAG: hypothetical protein NC337_13740, partial [Roseburia sp.]|nr:hypothetical protein [Roseburia sp.]
RAETPQCGCKDTVYAAVWESSFTMINIPVRKDLQAMKEHRNRAILFRICGLLLILIFVLALRGMMDSHKRKANAKAFVDYLMEHADAASADFEACGLVFSVVEKGDMQTVTDAYTVSVANADMLTVTDVDGWRFCYQSLGKYGDRLVQIDGHVEKVRSKEVITGSLKMEKEKNNYVCIEIKYALKDYPMTHESLSLNYRIPEFDEYQKAAFKDQKTAAQISQWISAEELSALYKKGRELEEILSAYCELKRHDADVTIRYTPLYGKAAPDMHRTAAGE